MPVHDHHGLDSKAAPFIVTTIHAEEGHVTAEFMSEDPHRHFSMTFWLDDMTRPVDRSVKALGDALVAATQAAMLDIMGDTMSPADIGAIVPSWQCRICDTIAPAGTVNWAQVERKPTFPGGEPILVRYCPDHLPPNA